MSYLPCLNPHCSSQGKPHPNCKCYSGQNVMAAAEGGEVHYCAKTQMHMPECEYFAQGGMVDEHKINALNDHLMGEPSEESKWDLGAEDKEHSVASALIHSGAHHLLNGHMHGAYDDNPDSLQHIANQNLVKKTEKYFANPDREHIDKFIKKAVGSNTNKLAEPLFRRMLANGGEVDGFHHILSYTNNIKKGSRLMDQSVESLFGGKSQMANVDSNHKEKLHKYIDEGKFHDHLKLEPHQAMAHGGEIKPEKSIFSGTQHMEKHMPEDNILIQAAKARVNDYLNSVKPIKEQGLLFDKSYEDKDKKKSYDRALEMANHPANILGHIKDGSILPEHVAHLRSLYPEIYSQLSKKINERIVNAKLNDERPDYHVRQGMSLFLGAPLDSTLTPGYIQAAQSVFAPQKPQNQQAPVKPKAKTSKLDKVASQYRTPEDAAVARQQKT